jgi:amidophosphoribosyltransferase
MLKKTSLKEKCGVIGVYTASNQAAPLVRQGLAALQHRGQESTGISIVTSENKIVTYKNMGLVPHVLTAAVLKKLGKSKIAIGHNRYATAGNSSIDNAQPLMVKKGKYALSIGHNGNLPDIINLRQELGEKKRSISDTPLVAQLLLKKRPTCDSWEKTLQHVLPQCRGAYTFVIVTNDQTLFGIRDPYGIRPLCLGKLPDGWILASESVALDAVGAEFVRDIIPGEIVKITSDGKLSSSFFGEPKRPQYCLFEYIYFARPDSFMNGQRVRAGREASGVLLGKRIRKKGLKPDVVIPVFESGYPSAKGVAKELQLPLIDAITTSNYVGRTFIQPGQENRVKAVNGKHNIIPDDILGKTVVVVDDSAVRLTTSRALAQSLKDAGAKEVYMAIASPPVVDQCDLGIDMRKKKDLPAAQFEKEPLEIIEQHISKIIDSHHVIYLPIEDTAAAMGRVKEDFYYTPFGGPHPMRGPQPNFMKRKKKQQGKLKICVFVSGAGTNLQKIIDTIESGTINAEITGVLSNKPDAYALTRAKKYRIPTKILPYKGTLGDKKQRELYEKELLEYIKTVSPDVIFLSGWMLVLHDTFLKGTQKLEIPVFNQHPAILSEKNDEFVSTSRGRIPVIRGHKGFEEAFEKKLPVSGITFHQVLPGDIVDVGPIVLKAEIRLHAEDTRDTFEKRTRKMEYLMLPTALKRIIHVLENNIDVSKGTFPWGA